MLFIKKWKHLSSFHENEYKLNSTLAKVAAKKANLQELSKIYTHIDSESINQFFQSIPNIKNFIKGNGIDLGGGPGIVSATLVNNFPEIKNIILLELVYEVLENCFPIVKNNLLEQKLVDKVIPVCGSFDELKLENKSLDFAIFWDSLHHSLNPSNTLKEIRRVLKNTGYLIIIDRAHNNRTSQKEIYRMLNIIYSRKFLKDNFLPIDTILTRRQNGENEYRFKDWEKFFRESKFDIFYKGLYLEKHPRNINYQNDAGICQKYISIELGGFEKRKVVYILKSHKQLK